MTLNNNFKIKFGNNFNQNVNLSSYNWFNLGGNADFFLNLMIKNN